jgi:hypothetical protein
MTQNRSTVRPFRLLAPIAYPQSDCEEKPKRLTIPLPKLNFIASSKNHIMLPDDLFSDHAESARLKTPTASEQVVKEEFKSHRSTKPPSHDDTLGFYDISRQEEPLEEVPVVQDELIVGHRESSVSHVFDGEVVS